MKIDFLTGVVQKFSYDLMILNTLSKDLAILIPRPVGNFRSRATNVIPAARRRPRDKKHALDLLHMVYPTDILKVQSIAMI